LRKTAATRVAKMFGIETASTSLGHSSKAVTQKYYIHPSEHQAPDVSAAFE
jgi:integrase